MPDSAKKTFLSIACTSCGKKMHETVAKLAKIHTLPCHFCGRAINLEAGRQAVTIREAVQKCADADALPVESPT